MRIEKTKTFCFFKNILFVALLSFAGLYFSFRKVSAAVDALPRPFPTVTATRRPPALQPISVSRPALPMWIGQGELHPHMDEFVCRVRCERNWLGYDLEILQATRGAEDWVSFEGEAVRCFEEEANSQQWFLHAGLWMTSADSPEDNLCFLVLTASRHVP